MIVWLLFLLLPCGKNACEKRVGFRVNSFAFSLVDHTKRISIQSSCCRLGASWGGASSSQAAFWQCGTVGSINHRCSSHYAESIVCVYVLQNIPIKRTPKKIYFWSKRGNVSLDFTSTASVTKRMSLGRWSTGHRRTHKEADVNVAGRQVLIALRRSLNSFWMWNENSWNFFDLLKLLWSKQRECISSLERR